jgi:hypothetical protein
MVVGIAANVTSGPRRAMRITGWGEVANTQTQPLGTFNAANTGSQISTQQTTINSFIGQPYVGCIAGAIRIKTYREELLNAGFEFVEIVDSGAD